VGTVEIEDVDICHHTSPQATMEAAKINQMTTEEGEDTTITRTNPIHHENLRILYP
jgi:hypothetical protein